jgi:hypothetical protein
MVDLESATIQLYEDESLTGDLQDTEAQLLLKWGETRLAPLIAQYAEDEEGFDAAFKLIRRFIRAVSQFVGNRQYADPEEQAELLTHVSETAQAANPNCTIGEIDTTLSDTALIQSLLAKVETLDSTNTSTDSPLSDEPEIDL